jgi:hypothetical protein
MILKIITMTPGRHGNEFLMAMHITENLVKVGNFKNENRTKRLKKCFDKITNKHKIYRRKKNICLRISLFADILR